MSPRIALLLLLFVTGADVAALTVTVNGPAGDVASPEVAARLRRVDSDEAVQQISLRIGAATEVDVRAGTWEIIVTSDEVWAAPLYASASDAATLMVWPRGEIFGTVGDAAPASGELLLHFAPTNPASDAPSGVSTCDLSDRKWRCPVPAGLFDVRLTLTGFATEFRWDALVAARGSLDLKRVDFTPGSSLIGYVETARGVRTDIRSAEVVIAVAGGGADAREGRTYKTKPNARGFFQTKGLAAGEYTIRATTTDLVSDVRVVQIINHTNATLKEPLILAKPATVTVTTMPPLDPQDQRWQVEFSRHRDRVRWLDIVDRSQASSEGIWTKRGVTPGEYIVLIQQQDGSTWKSEPITVASEDISLQLVLLGERVAGTVMLGDDPVAATLRFGGEHGQTVIASDDGHFSGVIAPPGDEPARIQVTSDAANIRRTVKLKGRLDSEGVRRFEIRLASTIVSGTILNEDGSPETGAIVTLDSNTGEDFEQTYSGDDGTFRLTGFDPGDYRLSAEAFLKRSDIVEVKVAETPSLPIELVLRSQVAIRGEVAMGAVPVAGAYVLAIPRGIPIQTGPHATSDAMGRFALYLPPGTQTYDVAVIPRGFYVSIGRVTASPDKILRAEVAQEGGSLRVDAPAGQYLRLLHAGAEFPLELLARRSEGIVEMSAKHQRLEIANLEPGMYSVCGTEKCVSAYVPRIGAAAVSLR